MTMNFNPLFSSYPLMPLRTSFSFLSLVSTMQTKNSINIKGFPTFKNKMPPRRKLNNDEEYTPSPSRKKLPRRCKSIQPFYAIDIDFEDEIDDHTHRIIKKKGLNTNKKPCQGLLPRKAKKKNLTDEMIQRKEDKTTISNNVISWLIEMKLIKEKSLFFTLQNVNHGQIMAIGVLDDTKIICCCCSKGYLISNFISHIRYSLADKYCENIYVGSPGVSLLNCQIEAWNRHSVPARSGYHHVERRPRVQDDYDDSCLICADGGQLICCDNCPSTYHYECVGIKVVPKDDWYCPYCQCKFCNLATTEEPLHTCFQCLKKYHWRCSDQCSDNYQMFQPANALPFCGNKCSKVYKKLEGRLGSNISFSNEFSWTIVRRTDLDLPGQDKTRSSYLKAYCNSMVVLAAKLMEETFSLIIDRQTRTNIVQSVVYSCGSNLTRTNFSRFYTAILEYQGQVVTVASLRIPSPEIAEIPFIATTESMRKQGLCKLLLSKLESVLADMGVERIVIPSSDEMVINWVDKFGFVPVDEETEREIKSLNTLTFPRTTRLMRVIPNIDNQLDLNIPPEEEV